MNILSFDLEDWYQLTHRRVTGELLPPRDSIFRQSDLLLELLEQHQTRATFFVVGMVAERYPKLIRRIAAQGHEIASHGYGHIRICALSRKEFADDTSRSRDLLQDIVGKAVCGYRAPVFSINGRTLWALEVLAALGFSYDSSIFPIHHRRYGIPGFYPSPARYLLPDGLRIVELPLATLSFAGIRVPVAGGGYFRAIPLWVLKQAISRQKARRVPMITYFHPYEFDTIPLDVFRTVAADHWSWRIAGWWLNWRNNLGRLGVRPKLGALMEIHPFTTCKEYLDAVGLRENRELLPEASTAV